MRYTRILLAASTLALFISACNTPANIQAPLEPQYGTALEDVGSRVATNEAGQLYTLGRISDHDESYYNMYDEPVLKRFDTSGKELWSRKLGVQCNGGNDVCSALTYGLGVDATGNSFALYGRVYDASDVFGYEATLKKFGASGTLLWAQGVYTGSSLNTSNGVGGMAMATTAGGETFVAYSHRDSDTGAVSPHLEKYSATGQKLFDKPHVIDSPSDAVVAGDGSLYIVGTGEAAKYTSAGSLAWARALPKVPNSAYEQVTVAGSNIYISVNTDRYAYQTGDKNLIALYKYTGGGTPVWQRTITPFNTAVMYGLSADASGNAYLDGETTPAAGSSDLFARKYTPSGSVAWTYTAALPGTREVAYDITAADSGKVYLVGTTDGKVNGQNYGEEDAFLLRLDTAGKKVWSR